MAKVKGRDARRARREKPPVEKDTYSSTELVARYSCSQITIRRREQEQGFPRGEKLGRELVYSKAAVHAWEREHMPALHGGTSVEEDEKQWDRMHRQRALDREGELFPSPKRTEKAKRHISL